VIADCGDWWLLGCAWTGVGVLVAFVVAWWALVPREEDRKRGHF
jgi:hypothetical protein